MVRTRFAPSPTGYMHIGNLRTALYAYLFAKKNNGTFILRIEDTDTNRYVPGASNIIIKTLEQAGIVCDEGPHVGGEYGPYVQSQRKEIYQYYAHKLIELGAAYPCFCQKHEGDGQNPAHKYDKRCLRLPPEEVKRRMERGDSYCIRQNIPASGESVYYDHVFGEIRIDYKDLEDNILLKSDGMPTYNLANVIDDHLMGITHVIRGVEYLSSTPKYNLLYDAFGWKRPEYIHLQPIMRDERRKLSKRDGDASFADFIKKGYLSHAIINYIALLGWSPKDTREKMSMQELIDAFSIEGISKSASIFDEAKMRWLNGLYVRELPLEEFNNFAAPYYEQTIGKDYDYTQLSKLLQNRIEIFSEIPEKIAFLNNFEGYNKSLYNNEKQKTTVELAKQMLPGIIDTVKNLPAFDNSSIFEAMSKFALDAGYKKNALFWIMRIALSGAEVTPGGATELAALLGYDRTLERLNYSLKYLSE